MPSVGDESIAAAASAQQLQLCRQRVPCWRCGDRESRVADSQGCRGDGISIPIPIPMGIPIGITTPTADLPIRLLRRVTADRPPPPLLIKIRRAFSSAAGGRQQTVQAPAAWVSAWVSASERTCCQPASRRR